jgi:hypothetical protein
MEQDNINSLLTQAINKNLCMVNSHHKALHLTTEACHNTIGTHLTTGTHLITIAVLRHQDFKAVSRELTDNNPHIRLMEAMVINIKQSFFTTT